MNPTTQLDAVIGTTLARMRFELDSEDGFVPVSFWVQAPLSDEQRQTLRCYGVVIWEDRGGTLMSGAVSRKGLPAFVSLPFVTRVDSNLQRDHTTQMD